MSNSDLARHEALVPLGCQVSSKARFRNCAGFGPDWIVRGVDACVLDDQGRQYLDWSCGLGAITIGHGMTWDVHPQCLPLPHRAELVLAERLNDWIPCAERVRFMKTGTDATSACVRLARVYTGKDIIVDVGNYHGCADWSAAPEHEGVPQCVRDLTKRVPYNDLEALEDELILGHVAAVIMEPVSLVAPKDWYLRMVRDLCTKCGVVLIFDEVITGIRMARGGAQEIYKVTPDLCAIGKGLANGYPISAVCGTKPLMDCWSRTHLSGTHFADPSCMEASIQTLDYLESRAFWTHQRHIGSSLLEGVQQLITTLGVEHLVRAVGHPHWWVLQIADEVQQTFVQQQMIEAGILGSNGSHFVSLAHSDTNVVDTLVAYHKAFTDLKHAVQRGDIDELLMCEPNRTIFRRN